MDTLNIYANGRLIGLSSKPHKDALGAGGATSLNRKSRKINDLRDYFFKMVTPACRQAGNW
jgi:hypothetical protein